VDGRLRDGFVMYSTKQVAHFPEILSGSFSNYLSQVSGMTYQIGSSYSVWTLFGTTGVLNNTVDQEFRGIGDDLPNFAFAHDLGTVSMTKTAPVVYAIGYVRDPLVQLSNLPNFNSVRSPYFLTRHGPDVHELVRSLYISYMAVCT